MAPVRETWRVWRQEDGRWRWTWEGTEGEILFSAHTFSSPDEAEESARAAYPNLLGSVEGRTVTARVAGGRVRKALLAGGCAAAVAVGLLRIQRRNHPDTVRH
jgi:uncharacterized protein YegP (UPF0339 family)